MDEPTRQPEPGSSHPDAQQAPHQDPHPDPDRGEGESADFDPIDDGKQAQPTGLFELAEAEAGRVRQLIEVIRLVSRDLIFRSPLPRMAAALAFRTIFGLIPIAVLGLVVLGEVISDEQLEAEITRLLDFTGITQIVNEDRVDQVNEQIEQERAGVRATPNTPSNEANSDGPPRTPQSQGSPESTEPGADGARAPPQSPDQPDASSSSPSDDPDDEGAADAGPDADAPASGSAPELDDWIRQIITQVREVSLRAIGFVGAIVLIYAAFTLIREIERSFNQIYDVSVPRSYLSSAFIYWTTITLGGLLLAGTFYVGDWIAKQLAEGFVSRGILELVINSLITLILLTVAYIGLPNTRVTLRTALGGAFVATLLWQVLKAAFRLYLQAATGYERLYGEIGLIPLFLLWIYLTWLVILFGLQISFAMQTFSVWRERTLRSSQTHADFVDPAALLAVAVALARRFERGEPATLPQLARAAGIGEAAATDLVTALVNASLAQPLREEGELRRYTLARPADRIATVDLIHLGSSLTASPTLAEESAVLAAFMRSRTERWRGTTLADLVRLEPGRSQRDRAANKPEPASSRPQTDQQPSTPPSEP